jgi:hypothetical protein
MMRMLGLALAFVGLLGWSTSGWSQDKVVSMIGTWLVKSDGMILGQSIHPEHSHSEAEPKAIAVTLRWVVEKQSGTTFSGTAIGPSGAKERFVGSLTQDGKRGVIINARGGTTDFVMLDANRFEGCYSLRDDKLLAAGCNTGTRQ